MYKINLVHGNFHYYRRSVDDYGLVLQFRQKRTAASLLLFYAKLNSQTEKALRVNLSWNKIRII